MQKAEKTTGGAAETQQGIIKNPARAVTGMQQQMRTGSAAGTQQKPQGAQHERSTNSAGLWQECNSRRVKGTQRKQQERSRNISRTVAGMQQQMRRGNAAKNDRGRSKNSAGIRQRCRNAAKMDAWDYIRHVGGTKQGCSRNAAKTTVVAAGAQQELGRAVLQECSDNERIALQQIRTGTAAGA